MSAFDSVMPTEDQLAAMPESARKVWQDMADQRAAGLSYRDGLVEEGELLHASVMFSSEERAEAFVSWDEQGLLDDPDLLRSLLESEWSVSEGWQHDPRLRDGMLRLLERVAPLYVDGEPPEGEFTIYRGNLGEVPGGRSSWTLSRETAERFAVQPFTLRGMVLGMTPGDDARATIWQARTSREHVLGFFNDRGETEVITDGSIWDVEMIGQAEARDAD